MGVAGLDLLRDRVHVAKAAFELVGAEYGGGARHVIGGVDHRGRLVNRPGRGEAKRYPVLFAEIPGLRQIAPRLIGCRIEIGTRRTQIAFEAADCALNGIILAHRLETERRLAARQIDGRVERGVRDAKRDRGKAQSEHGVGGDAIERPLFTQRRGVVAQYGEFFRNEQVVDGIRIGAGAVEADHIPDVVHRGARHRKQDRPHLRSAIGLAAPGAIGFHDLDMRAEPARLTAAAGKIPARGGAITAGHDLHFVVDRAPGEDAGWGGKNLARRVGIEIGCRHGADGALAKAPRRGGVGLRHLLQHLHEDFGRRLGAADALRQEHAIKPVLDQG